MFLDLFGYDGDTQNATIFVYTSKFGGSYTRYFSTASVQAEF